MPLYDCVVLGGVESFAGKFKVIDKDYGGLAPRAPGAFLDGYRHGFNPATTNVTNTTNVCFISASCSVKSHSRPLPSRHLWLSVPTTR